MISYRRRRAFWQGFRVCWVYWVDGVAGCGLRVAGCRLRVTGWLRVAEVHSAQGLRPGPHADGKIKLCRGVAGSTPENEYRISILHPPFPSALCSLLYASRFRLPHSTFRIHSPLSSGMKLLISVNFATLGKLLPVKVRRDAVQAMRNHFSDVDFRKVFRESGFIFLNI